MRLWWKFAQSYAYFYAFSRMSCAHRAGTLERMNDTLTHDARVDSTDLAANEIATWFQLLSDAQWSLIADLLPTRIGERDKPLGDTRHVIEGIMYRYQCGIAWPDVPEAFGPWQTILAWHCHMYADGTWDAILARLLSDGNSGAIKRALTALALDPILAAAHRRAANITRHPGGWLEIQEPTLRESTWV
ncbi:transposase [Mycobacterium haemophilum DSM 44634]